LREWRFKQELAITALPQERGTVQTYRFKGRVFSSAFGKSYQLQLCRKEEEPSKHIVLREWRFRALSVRASNCSFLLQESSRKDVNDL
jgi:hypothetical protein